MATKNYLMVSECDGHMYDTRAEDWHKRRPLRAQYAVVKRNVAGDSIALRAAIRARCAWPGGDDLFGITTDGGALCCDCMRGEYYQIAYSRRRGVNDGWRVIGVECTANCYGPVYCDHCGKTIVDGGEEEDF